MPYADPAKRAAAQRDAQRRRRAGLPNQPKRQPLPELRELQYKTATDILTLLGDQVAAILADGELSTLEKARTVGYLAGVMLRAVDSADLERRLTEIEAMLEKINGGDDAKNKVGCAAGVR